MFEKLFESSVGLGIRYYSNQAYQTTISLLHQIERFGIGYTREFINDPKAMIQTLTSQARSSDTGCSVISLGYLGGNYAVITPQSQNQLLELVTEFDKEPSSRKGHASFKFFSGNSFFIISDMGHTQMASRKNLSRFLAPTRLAYPMIQEIERAVPADEDIQIRHTVCGIVRAVMLENMLGITQLPENTYDIMEAYRNDVKRWAAFPFPELLNFMPSLRKKRDIYQAFSKSILEQEFNHVVKVLHTHDNPANANLIAASIVTLYKDQHPELKEGELGPALKNLSTLEIRQYFENPVVQSLPMILKAADNLTDAIVLCLEQIAEDPSKFTLLRKEIETILLNQDLDLIALKSLPVLDAVYRESIRFDSPVIVPRFTKKGYQSDSITIPPDTMVLFDLGALAKGKKYWTNPDEFDYRRFLQTEEEQSEELNTNSKSGQQRPGQFPLIPFFVGLRNCPAFAVTEVLFKVAIAKFVADYDLQFVKREENDTILHVQLLELLEQSTYSY
ncbi:putative unspecific monooxygenase [Legionella wadsworthii]|uniref:Putative unspecific monooxygenase n=1 Tax=Legionella wadsworthii TaxID=28088 RepID=A0A378LPG2_9GAMM|nr:cytochrome P450 [Legionella wadsworthii]STY28260.1 putative unspecific monooxygenase [Legionella wadsworthii]